MGIPESSHLTTFPRVLKEEKRFTTLTADTSSLGSPRLHYRMQPRQLQRAVLHCLLLTQLLLLRLASGSEGLVQEDFVDAEGKMQLSLDYLQPETIQSTCRLSFRASM